MALLPDADSKPCMSADEAFSLLGIDRKTGYRAIKEGTFPLPVIRVGRLIRVPTAALLRLLAADSGSPEYSDTTDPDQREPVKRQLAASG